MPGAAAYLRRRAGKSFPVSAASAAATNPAASVIGTAGPLIFPGDVLEREAAILAGQSDAHRTMRRASHGGQPRCTSAAI
jgi:hypothetical protein